MPDTLMRRIKIEAAKRKTTFRALVVDALERSLKENHQTFELEDAAVGPSPSDAEKIGNDAINRAIDAQRESRFVP